MKIKDYILPLLKNLAHPAGIVGLFFALAIPFAVYLAPNYSEQGKEVLRVLDLGLPLPLFFIQLVWVVSFSLLLFNDFTGWVKNTIPARTVTMLAIIFAIVATVFAATQIEARHRVQSDESIFLSVAQSMYYNQQSGTCNQGEFTNGTLNCFATSNSFKTKGLAFLYLLGMPLFGTDLHWVFNAELLLLPLSLILLFLAIAAWTKQPLLAFFATLLMGLQPTILFQYRSMSVEPLYIFLSALSLLIFKWACDRNTIRHWIMLALVLAFFAQTRQETVFCFLPFIFYALPKILDKKDSKAPVFFVVLSIFSVPVLITISYFQGFGFQGGEFDAHGHFFEDLIKNWEVMTTPLKSNGDLANPFLTYFNYMFALGLAYLIFRALRDTIKGNKFYLKVLVFLALYHIQSYMILENVSGDFSIEINQRYSLVMLPSMAFLAALPLTHFIQWLANATAAETSKNKGSSSRATALTLIFTLIATLIFTGWTFHYKECFNKNIMYNRNHLTLEEHALLGWLKEQPKTEKFFIYGRPWHFVGYGISSIHYNKARTMKDGEIKQLIEKYNGEVYYVRGLDCWDSQTYHKKAVEHRIATTCDVFEKEFELEGVKNFLITNNYWVQIAKLKGRRDYNPQGVITPMTTSTDSSGNTLYLRYQLREKSETTKNWSVSININDSTFKSHPYRTGTGTLAVLDSLVIPGFNKIQYLVTDSIKNKVIASITDFYFSEKNGATLLTSMSYTQHQQGWGSFHTNETIEGNTFKIDGMPYKTGLGTHAPSTTTYNIGKKYSTFKVSVGLDDESLCSDGVTIQIEGDGQVLAQTEGFKVGYKIDIEANVKDIENLTLKSILVGGIDCSHVDFINPVLIQ
ncbi:MAG: NPCBM/NEW2 domain-containing protein [Fibrobacteraceae bacterium]|nr:NPCBM/NEW2 domain-containing protein [Fibrobacteraceae bacterium]